MSMKHYLVVSIIFFALLVSSINGQGPFNFSGNSNDTKVNNNNTSSQNYQLLSSLDLGSQLFDETTMAEILDTSSSSSSEDNHSQTDRLLNDGQDNKINQQQASNSTDTQKEDSVPEIYNKEQSSQNISNQTRDNPDDQQINFFDSFNNLPQTLSDEQRTSTNQSENNEYNFNVFTNLTDNLQNTSNFSQNQNNSSENIFGTFLHTNLTNDSGNLTQNFATFENVTDVAPQIEDFLESAQQRGAGRIINQLILTSIYGAQFGNNQQAMSLNNGQEIDQILGEFQNEQINQGGFDGFFGCRRLRKDDDR